MVLESIKKVLGLVPKELENISADSKLSDIELLSLIKATLTKVYTDQVSDESFDNGMLDQINNAVKAVENVIDVLKRREGK